MVFYKIIRIKILREELSDNISEKDNTKSVNTFEPELNEVQSFDDITINDNESFEPSIKLTINDKENDDTKDNEISDPNQYVTITACFNWKVTNNPIEDLGKTYLIGTDIITNLGDKLPIVKIDSNSDSIKYKKVVRDNSKKLFNISNKDIITIKHLNNIDNYHNYLVLLKRSKKLIAKFKNSIECVDKNSYKWRTYFGLYDPKKINPSKAEIYDTLSKNKYVTNTLSIDKSEIKLKDIYKTLSYVIGEEVY